MKREWIWAVIGSCLSTSLVAAQGYRLPEVSQAPVARVTYVQKIERSEWSEPVELVPVPAVSTSAENEFTLQDLEQLALRGNPSLVVAMARVEAAQGRWEQVGLPPNPVAGYSGQQLGSRGIADQQGVLIGQQLVTAGKLRLNRSVANQEIVRARQDLAAQELRVLTDVRSGFYQVLVAQRRLELVDELVQISQRGVEAAENLVKEQQATRPDFLQARVEFNTARIVLQNAENRHLSAWRQLAATVGIPDLEPTALSGELQESRPELSWEDSLLTLLRSSPEVAAAISEVERARWILRRARAEVIPDIDVQGVIQQDNSTGSSNGNLQVVVPLPLLNRNQGNIREAHAALMAAERDVDRLALNLQQRLATAFERYASARGQVERYEKEIIPDAKETLDLVTRGYKAGEFSFLNLLLPQRTYFQTNLSYLDAVAEVWAARTEIEGMLLYGSLQNEVGGGASAPR